MSTVIVPFRLLSLPREIISSILGCLDIVDLGIMECVCQNLRPLVLDTYKKLYGPGPLHLISAADRIDYRSLATDQYRRIKRLEDEMKDLGVEMKGPKALILELLDEFYFCQDDELNDIAADALVILRGSSECDTEIWNEAVATALMAQHRPEDAGKYYELASKNGKSLSEQTNLTAARWSWPFTAISLPDITTGGILERACIGAALGGNVSLLACLQSCENILDFVMPGSLASAAARMGQIDVLKLLHSYKVDLQRAPPRGDCPLSGAAQYGCYEAAKFLLDAGCRPDLSGSYHIQFSPVDDAAFHGKTEILRLFVKHCPELRTARTSNGNLRIQRAIEGKQINVINFFIKELEVDINEADDAGQTALHLAVDSKDKQVVEAVMVLGASLEKRDISGQTAYERAISRNYPTADSFVGISASFSGLKERKMALTGKILELLRDTYFQTLAMRYSQTSDLVRVSWFTKNMESKLSEIWVSSMSSEALHWYATQILGSTMKDIYLSIIALFTSTAAISGENVGKGDVNLHAASDVATAILPHGTNSDISRLAIRIKRNVAVPDLLRLRDCFRSPSGQCFTAGIKAKAPEEAAALTRFAIACDWL